MGLCSVRSTLFVAVVGVLSAGASAQPGCLTPPVPPAPENEACGASTNSGCVTNDFRAITCGEVASGTVWSDQANRDYDWYRLTLAGPHLVTVRAQAQFPMQVSINNDLCPSRSIVSSTPGVCEITTLTTVVGGTCTMVVNGIGPGISCGGGLNNYWIQVVECAPVDGPANDDCLNAMDIGDGFGAYDLRGATNDWPGSCGSTLMAEDVWFRFTSPFTGIAHVTTCGGAADSVISVLAECAGPEIVCLDDICGLQAEVAFSATIGEDYLIRFAQFGGGAHEGNFFIYQRGICDLFPPGPTRPEFEPCGADTNGGCASSPPAFEPIVCGDIIHGTAWATGGGGDTDWYELPLDGPRQLTVHAQGAFPMRLTVYDGACPPNVLAEGSAGHCNWVTLTVPVSGTCRISVHDPALEFHPCGFDAGSDYWLSVDCAPQTPPGNDDCAHATDIAGFGPHAFNTRLATTDGATDPACGINQIIRDVWFDWASQCPAGDDVIVSLCGTTGSWTMAAVYQGDSCVGPIIACSQDGCSNSDPELRFTAGPPGSIYKIRIGVVAGFGVGGPGAFTVECRPGCPCNFNDDDHLNSQDFFDFLTCFFSGQCPPGHDADYNNDALVNSQDFFDFLACFFAPPKFCP